jgi:peptidylprolyl isomerase
MRCLCALLPLALLACSTSKSNFAGGDDAASADSGIPGDAASPLGSDSGPPLPSCFPTGYALVPFVTTTPIYSFTKAEQVLDMTKQYSITLDTDAGCIAMSMYTSQAPITCNSFAFLTLHHYFDGTAFHRVIDGFVAQGGDPNTINGPPSTWGNGGPGYYFGLEVTPSLNYTDAGIVGMARTADVNSNGSQFFITLAAAPALNQQYTVFMNLTAGLEVLPKIARGSPPVTPTRVLKAYLGVQ